MKMMTNMLLGNIGIPCQVKTRRLATFLAGYSFYLLLLLKGVRKASILIVLCLLSFEWSSARLLEQGMKHFSTFIMTVYSRPICSAIQPDHSNMGNKIPMVPALIALPSNHQF